MASYSIAAAKHATLVASTVDTVTFTANIGEVEVVNWGTANRIFLTTDGTTAPTVAGDNTYSVGPNGGALKVNSNSDVIKLICATANDYSITGF